MRAPVLLLPLLLPSLLLGGCKQEMAQQRRMDTYEQTGVWKDGTTARPIPAGTVARGDRAALARYVSPRVKTAAASTPPANLLRVACEGDMCSYTSEQGERLTLTFDRAAVKAGRTGGIVGIKLD